MYKPKTLLIITLAVVSTAMLLFSDSLVLATCPSADLSGNCFVDYEDFALMGGQWTNEYDCNDLTVMATEWLTEGVPDPNGMVWVYINDLGVPSHEAFNGEMSKYEMTNAQYCQFLNAALASGDVTVSSNIVYGANGSNSGEDFVGQDYYNLAGSGTNWDGATNGGAARIHYSGGVFTVDSGFENHPVTYVSWYGATAFCNYYGFRLPTEWEWQAVADFDGSYTYGCGTSINNSIANYYGSTHPDGTAVVGNFGNPAGYGYGMNDMAGNVWEWTGSISGSFRIIRGGGWDGSADICRVAIRSSTNPLNTFFHVGFRVCR